MLCFLIFLHSTDLLSLLREDRQTPSNTTMRFCGIWAPTCQTNPPQVVAWVVFQGFSHRGSDLGLIHRRRRGTSRSTDTDVKVDVEPCEAVCGAMGGPPLGAV